MPGRALLTLAKSEQRILSLRKLIGEPAITLERDANEAYRPYCLKHCVSKGRHRGFCAFRTMGWRDRCWGTMFERARSISSWSRWSSGARKYPRSPSFALLIPEFPDAVAYLLSVPAVLGSIELQALKAIGNWVALCAPGSNRWVWFRSWDGAATAMRCG